MIPSLDAAIVDCSHDAAMYTTAASTTVSYVPRFTCLYRVNLPLGSIERL